MWSCAFSSTCSCSPLVSKLVSCNWIVASDVRFHYTNELPCCLMVRRFTLVICFTKRINFIWLLLLLVYQNLAQLARAQLDNMCFAFAESVGLLFLCIYYGIYASY